MATSNPQPLWDNPLGTDGFEFIEYAAPDPAALGAVFEKMGFAAVARHRSKNVLLYRQGGINFIVNAEPDSFAQRFARLHGPSICAIAFRVQDAKAAYERAIALGAWGYAGQAGPGELNIPAIKGIGDSLIYLVDRWRGKNGAKAGDIGNIGFFDVDFEPLAGAGGQGPGVVLVGVAVEHHRVGLLVLDPLHVGGAALGPEVELGLHEHVAAADGRQARRVDHDRPEHAVGDVRGHRHRRAVVHPDAGTGGAEAVHQ